jgi:hypothetical protein
MIIIKLSGGLGNQMFQYAYARNLQTRNPLRKICLDISDLQNGYRNFELHHFNITLPIIDELNSKQVYTESSNLVFGKLKKLLYPYYKQQIIQEKFYHFDKNLLNIKHNAFVEGYFQTEKYFKEIEPIIRQEFTFKNEPDAANQKFLEQIKGINVSVSLHIRRGDFVNNPTHPLQSESFFQKAFCILKEKYPTLHIFVFSNDMVWVKNNLSIPFAHTFVENNNEANGIEDFRLMTHCKHHIIANSSFSWWAAWLSPYPNKIVIAPSKWVSSQDKYYKNLNDVIPESWIKI